MKRFKRIIAVALMIVMMFSISVTSYAAELNQDKNAGTANAVYKAGTTTNDNGTPDPSDDSVDGTYTITIPDYIVVAPDASQETMYDVTAKNVLIPYGTSLNVSVTFEPELKLDYNDSVLLGYQLKNKSIVVNTNDKIVTVVAGNPDAVTTTQVSAVLTEKPLYAGVYTDTVIFTSSINPTA